MSRILIPPRTREGEASRARALDGERAFYQGYPWCLNPYPTVGETVGHLRAEIDRLRKGPEGWQAGEVLTNVYLLSCALLNAVDDYLRGKTFRLPRKARRLPLLGRVLRGVEKLADLLRLLPRRRLRRWRECWQSAFDAFVPLLLIGEPDLKTLADLADGLAELLPPPLPASLQVEHIYFPSAFRKHDLTPHDVIALGRQFSSRFPDRTQPLLIIGLRSAGSYFAPVLRAFLQAEGFATVAAVTVRPDRGLGKQERAQLAHCARGGYMALILDDAPGTGNAIALATDLARKAGFAPDRLAVLVPVHPANRDWRTHLKSLPLADTAVIELAHEDWYKQRLLEPKAAEQRLAEYFQGHGFVSACVVTSPAVDQFNAELEAPSEEPRRKRLKQVYEVRLQTADGAEETRYVLAKSVGWGWLGYHAFLAADALADFVPPLLGLRDGILHTEWLPQAASAEDRERRINTTASYVAARVRSLGLTKNPLPSLGLHQHHDGFGLLDKVLSKAYGGTLLAGLMRPRVRRRLANLPCPVPTLIDGKMQRSEWITGPRGPLKTDFEHHGMGKNELNLVDPAFDLAESILHLALSPEEEDRLLRRYAEESGDARVRDRLPLNKLFAGTWAMASALKHLFYQPQLTHRQQEFHEQFVTAWHFLTIQAARFCGSLCRPLHPPRWRSPLVVLDLDGVLDRRLLGFPHTSAAGIEALALLHAHEFAVAVNTARCVPEVQEYCRAYGLAGGVAEYGSYAWDAVRQQGRVLVGAEALAQLERARAALRQLPGIFLDDRYLYSIRAVTYEDKSPPVGRALVPYNLSSIRSYTSDDKSPAPLPTLPVQHLLADLRLDALTFHQTTIDTAIVAREADKGSGLSALLGWVGVEARETAAIGDSEPDLPMFRVAGRSFAPAQVGCASLARMLGCKIVRRPFQRGLLDIARMLVRPRRARVTCQPPPGADLFFELLRAADRPRSVRLMRALLDPGTYRVFLR